ncbi:hypothetical protein FB451DRAFT_1398210 [Mycena latifolia]|nr:hypothetical protein FB451DRAFT_1398210 [Mycena latifolia]
MLAKRPDLSVHVVHLSVDLLLCSTPLWPNILELGDDPTATLIAKVSGELWNLQSFKWAGQQLPPDHLWLALRNACPKLKSISCITRSIHFDPECELFKFDDLVGFALWVSYEKTKEPPGRLQDIPAQLCDMLLERCPRLETLSIRLLSIPNLQRLSEISRLTTGTWPKLRSLHLDLFLLDCNPIWAQPPARDLGVFLSTHPHITDLCLRPFAIPGTVPPELPLFLEPEALPQMISFEAIYQHVAELPNPEGLERLVLNTEITEISPIIPVLRRLAGLKTLRVILLDVDEHSALQDIIAVCHLTRFDVEFHRRSLNHDTKWIGEISRYLQRLPRLRTFSLTKKYRLLDETMLSSALILLGGNPLLHELRVINIFKDEFFLQQGLYRILRDAEHRKYMDVMEYGLRRAYPPERFNRSFRYSLEGDRLLRRLSNGRDHFCIDFIILDPYSFISIMGVLFHGCQVEGREGGDIANAG